jgi:hypothetical protein
MSYGISSIFTLSLFILYIVPNVKKKLRIVTASITFILDFVLAYFISKFIAEEKHADTNMNDKPLTLVRSNLVYLIGVLKDEFNDTF